MHNECTIKCRTLGATRAQICENARAINTNNAHVPFQNGQLHGYPYNAGSGVSLQWSGLREIHTNFFTFVACSVRDILFGTNEHSRGEISINKQRQTDPTTVTLASRTHRGLKIHAVCSVQEPWVVDENALHANKYMTTWECITSEYNM